MKNIEKIHPHATIEVVERIIAVAKAADALQLAVTRLSLLRRCDSKVQRFVDEMSSHAYADVDRAQGNDGTLFSGEALLHLLFSEAEGG